MGIFTRMDYLSTSVVVIDKIMPTLEIEVNVTPWCHIDMLLHILKLKEICAFLSKVANMNERIAILECCLLWHLKTDNSCIGNY